MPNIKSAVLGLLFFILGLLFLVLPAQAENWIEVTAVGQPQSFYDSDSVYVDYSTGLVAVKMTTWTAEYNEYTYILNGFDCSRWEYYTLGMIISDGGWGYDIYGEFEVNNITDPTSPVAKTAQWACNNYDTHPSGNIPFDFKFSNY